MPESVGVLTREQALGHQQKVLLQLLIFLRLGRQIVHAAHESRIDPTVAAAPVAVLSVLLLVWRNVVGIAPPQTLFRVEQTAAARVTCPAIHPHGVVAILLLTRNVGHLHVERHSHLDGVYPRPPSIELRFAAAFEFSVGNLLAVGCLHLMVEVGDDVGKLGLLVTTF